MTYHTSRRTGEGEPLNQCSPRPRSVGEGLGVRGSYNLASRAAETESVESVAKKLSLRGLRDLRGSNPSCPSCASWINI